MLTTQISAIVVFFASVQSSLQAITAYESFYSAGVVEFRPSYNLNSKSRLQDNLQGYLTILSSEEARNLDIIVFPESTLNDNDQATFVPNPKKESVVPCDLESSDYDSLLKQLSCAVKNVSAYVVINLTEKEWCETVKEDSRPCAQSGLNLFNTNVVFDRKGRIISRYRKVHLYYGENINTTLTPEVGWFDTDFGVRFGHFICFDILFYAPAQSMVYNNGIKDFSFPSMWFSQLPFLTAVQVQQAWSYANNVNLLAAGASNPLVGSTGTGVYHGRQGIIVAKMNQAEGERKLYLAKVPKYRILSKRSLYETDHQLSRLLAQNITLKRDYLEDYKSVLLDLYSTTSSKQELCFLNSSLCCKFELKWSNLTRESEGKHYQYRLGVYDGWRNEIAAETNQLKNCALFSCTGRNIKDCGKRFDTEVDVIFENITITATFPKAERFLIMPNSLKADLLPLPVNHFQWQVTDYKNTVKVRYELNTLSSNIMAFSIYGNYYDCIVDIRADEMDGEGDGAAALAHSFVGIISILLINLML